MIENGIAEAKAENQRFKKDRSKYDRADFYVLDNSDLRYVLDTLGLAKAYEDAKWRMYCVRCDRPVIYTSEAKICCNLPDTLTYGELDLQLTSLEYEKDTFLFHHAAIKDSTGFGYKLSFCFGNCEFEKRSTTDRRMSKQRFDIYYAEKQYEKPVAESRDGLVYTFIQPVSANADNTFSHLRIYMPLQPEVISYVRTHADKINPWFHREAIGRGVFDSALYPSKEIFKKIKQNKRHRNDYNELF